MGMMASDLIAVKIAELAGRFDGEWYLARYPDVAVSGMSPAEHFLWLGERLGRSGVPQLLPASVTEMKRSSSPFHRPEVQRWSIEAFQQDQRIDFAERLEIVGPPENFRYSPLISLILPIYQSQIRFLEVAIGSVFQQNYQNWELCIVDDGSCSAELDAYLAELPNRDPRVRIRQNRENRGISHASNCCLEMAQGEFIALFDHDDILTLDALAHNVRLLNRQPELDLIYSDECRVNEDNQILDMFRKPDWSSYMLFNSMYTGHFSLYRRSLIVRLGGWRSQFDFSQDYDLALRVADVTDRVGHIPELLYGWRAVPGSGASGGKDHARETNIAALADAMYRRGISGNAVALPTANRADRIGTLPSPLVSIIIPSDNMLLIRAAIAAILLKTAYPNFEIIVVTNSTIVAQMANDPSDLVSFATFDAKFNFSAKCNLGANSASGEYFLFFNDDVRPIGADWIEALLEYAALPDVGAVGAKLLYEDGTIQHAGMVTGVRNLVGTAFHCLPAGTAHHFNMAQCVREVSLICGAVVMLRRAVFYAIAGWDENHFSIAHSDIDLCLKVWDAGFKCLYTPYSELLHIGHVSIGEEEKKETVLKKDKADISFLRKWPRQAAYDPYWPPSLSRGVYADSQEFFQVLPGKPHALGEGADILIASHEMTQSGAPQMVAELARVLGRAGHFVTVIAPTAGPMCADLHRLGVTVIIDELLLGNHDSIGRFCSNFDVVIVNTIVMWPLIRQLHGKVPIKWYIHESSFLNQYIPDNQINYLDFADDVDVWAVTNVPAKILSGLGWKSRILPPGFSGFHLEARPVSVGGTVRILVLGGYEPRKGQDLACAMLDHLPANIDAVVDVSCYGRVVDQGYFDDIQQHFGARPNVHFGDGVARSEVGKLLRGFDIVLIPSRDESFSLVALEAMMTGAVVLCSREVGISEYMRDGEDGFIVDCPDPTMLADGLVRTLAARDSWPAIRRNSNALGRKQFNSAAFGARVLELLCDCLPPD